MRGPLGGTAWRWVGLFAVGLLVSPALVGSSSAAPSDVVPGSDPRALALLGSAARAETAVTYRGTELVDTDDDLPGAPAPRSVQVVDVSHRVGDGTLVVVRGTAAAQARAGFADATVRRPQLLVPLLQRAYRVDVEGVARVADRAARVVVARRSDGSVAGRFWVDVATGLVLRRDRVDRGGTTVASTRFTALSLDASAMAYLPPLLPTLTSASLDDATLQGWRARGWPCPSRLGDMTLYDARTVAGDADVLHLSYSDGLSTTSLFVQPGTLDVDGVGPTRVAVLAGQPVRVTDGEPRQVYWSADGYVLTLVSDAPAEDLAEVVAGLPRAQPAPTGLARLLNGLGRVGSWVNPFD